MPARRVSSGPPRTATTSSSRRDTSTRPGWQRGHRPQRPWEFTLRATTTVTARTRRRPPAGTRRAADGEPPRFTPISGMAPRARIAAYKGLWSSQYGSTASGSLSDLTRRSTRRSRTASMSSTTPSVQHAAAELHLARAGVVPERGCSGRLRVRGGGERRPGSGTVKNPGPWITTVAAGTHNRASIGSVTLGNGTTINGASSGKAVGPAPFVDAQSRPAPDGAAQLLLGGERRRAGSIPRRSRGRSSSATAARTRARTSRSR